MKGVARFLFAFLLVYFFGRTAYQLSFFVKAGLGRYWFYPLATQRPDPCGPRTPPADVLLTSLVPIAGTGTAITTERDTRIGGAFGDRDASFEARSFDDGLSEGAALGARAGRKLAGGGGGGGGRRREGTARGCGGRGTRPRPLRMRRDRRSEGPRRSGRARRWGRGRSRRSVGSGC